MSTALKLQLGATLTALVLVSALVLQVSSAAFSDTTANTGNVLSAGTVVLTDNDAGSAMFNVSGMKPGDTETRCIRVTYSGSLAASVKVYGSVTGGNGLGTYLDFTVERGSGLSGAFPACTDFVSAATVYSPGTVAGFTTSHTDYSNGAGAFAVAENDTVDYRFTAVLQDNNDAQGLSTEVTITWEAQNT